MTCLTRRYFERLRARPELPREDYEREALAAKKMAAPWLPSRVLRGMLAAPPRFG